MWNLIDLLWNLLQRTQIVSASVLPLKFAGIVTARGKRERVRLAIRHDLDWDRHYFRSKKKLGYWYSRKPGRLQVMDLVIEWRFGPKGLNVKSED